MTRMSAVPVPTTATAARAAGNPTPRPLAGSIGPATTAPGAALGVALGVSWMGPGGETGGWMTPPGRGVRDREPGRCFGVRATCGPVPPDADAVGVGACTGVGAVVREGLGDAVWDGCGRLPTVMDPCAVFPGADPLLAVTESRPGDVPMKSRPPVVDEFGATCCE